MLYYLPSGVSNDFLCSQIGQTSIGEVKRLDLRAELLAAEQEARNKKRKAEGLPLLEDSHASSSAPVDEEANKRRKLLQEALELDKDDDEEEEGEEGEDRDKSEGER